MKNINTGADFLNLVFKDMKDSIESESKDPTKKIEEYLEKLESAHGKALSDEHKLATLKAFYYDKYIIKSLPESYIKYRKGYFRDLGLAGKQQLTDEDKKLVLDCIKHEQIKSLDNWLDYLFNKDNQHPTWFKYYVFQGIVKVGSFYPVLGDFTKRSASTTDPFIPVEPEVLDKMYTLVTKILDNEPLTVNEQRITAKGLNFRNLYSRLYTKENTIYSTETYGFDDELEHIGPAFFDIPKSSTTIEKPEGKTWK